MSTETITAQPQTTTFKPASQVIPTAPLGSIIAFSDLQPEPPARFNKKHAAWRNRNGSGRLVRIEPSQDGHQAHFTLHTGDYGSGDVIVLTVRQTFALDTSLQFAITKLPPPGSVAVLTKFRDVPELHHLAPSQSEAESWLHSNPYTDAYLEPIQFTASAVPAPPLTSLAEFKKALTPGSRWQYRFATRTAAGCDPTISTWQKREVVHVQSNAVAFAKSYDADVIKIAATNPHKNASWLNYPKATELSFPEPGRVRVTPTDDPDYWFEYQHGEAPSP